jgi:hypothetical protein
MISMDESRVAALMRNFMKRSALPLAMTAALIGGMGRADADTIVSITGQNNGGYVLGALSDGYSQVVAASWTQTQSYTNVSVYVPILETGSDTIDAYLVRGTVPQPESNEIAQTTFTAFNGLTTYAVFSGLSLGAGTYSIVLDSPTESNYSTGWEYSASPQITLGTGVSTNGPAYTSFDTSVPSYAPDDPNFRYTNQGVTLDYIVTGTVASVPEPSSIVIAGIGLAVLGGFALRRRNAMN